jgi:hypothetical protein
VIFALIVFVAMTVMDTAAACKIDLLNRKRPWLAGAAEIVNDQAGVFSYGIGGAALLRFGASGTTAVILVALAAASELGTVLGDWVSTKLPDNPQPTTKGNQ